MKTIEIPPSLKAVTKRLRLSGLLPTLPDRIAYARKEKLSELQLLELVLQDEIDRRDNKQLSTRLERAGFEDEQTFEGFDWDTKVTFERDRVRDLLGLGFIDRAEDAIFMGPVGVGKTFLACALGHAACRAGHDVMFVRADVMLRQLHQSRADLSTERAMRRLLAPDLLIIDDFGLRRLDPEQSSDIYELIIERHRKSSTIVTSNRSVDEWVPLFDDPLLAQSALDRLGHNAYQLVMEGPSYRDRQRPDRRVRAEVPVKPTSRRSRRKR
ncbi:IS21-like element helper ATPase IstB [Paraliomyxa miuraensis]|uniref:IS21-like element helper ATPase IstB n=1 Tax=Paraliomyxa miuraensis TaxID=376150 RepID=UPI002254E758|nr:IS21-like element helper ATPase IstB [Paraliomyxa miuraensis]MCX4239076.1 IS21-like element helper ATPase IstB [Paraliomyxa miuraensis]